MRKLPLLLALLALCVACSRVPDMVLPAEPMARLLADLQLADAVSVDQRIGQFASDSSRRDLRRDVLAKHGVNEAIVDSSLRWYGANLPAFLQVIDRADSILLDSLRKIEGAITLAAEIAAGDSSELDAGLSRSTVWSRKEPSEFLTFALPADSTWQRGDVVTLHFAVDNAQSPVLAVVGADYANRGRLTETISETFKPGDRRRFELKLQLDSNVSVKRIFGYMHLKPQEGERAFADSIRLVRTRLVGNDYNKLRRKVRGVRRHDF